MLRKDRDVGIVPRSACTPRFLSSPGMFGLQKGVWRQRGDHETLEEHEPHPAASTNGRKGWCKWPSCNANRGIVRDSAGAAAVALEGTFIEMLKVLCFSA